MSADKYSTTYSRQVEATMSEKKNSVLNFIYDAMTAMLRMTV